MASVNLLSTDFALSRTSANWISDLHGEGTVLSKGASSVVALLAQSIFSAIDMAYHTVAAVITFSAVAFCNIRANSERRSYEDAKSHVIYAVEAAVGTLFGSIVGFIYPSFFSPEKVENKPEESVAEKPAASDTVEIPEHGHEDLSAEIASLRASIAELPETPDDHSSNSDLEAIRQRLAPLEARLKALESKSSDDDKKLSEGLEGLRKSIDAGLSEKAKDIGDLGAQQKTLDDKIERLTGEHKAALGSAVKDLLQLQTALASHKKDLVDYKGTDTTKFSGISAEIKSLQGALRQFEGLSGKINGLEKSLAEKTRSLEESISEKTSGIECLASAGLSEELSTLRKDLKEAQEESGKLNTHFPSQTNIIYGKLDEIINHINTEATYQPTIHDVSQASGSVSHPISTTPTTRDPSPEASYYSGSDSDSE